MASSSGPRAAAAARELRHSTTEEGCASHAAASSQPAASLRDRKPVTPRDVVANAAPVHIDDASAKRVKAALSKRGAVLQACPDAKNAFDCLQESQENLASSRGAVATMRANYQELYDICESWHEKCLALESAAEEHAGAAQRERDFAATLAACEAFQKKQRLQLEDCQKALLFADQAKEKAEAAAKAAAEQAAAAKKALGVAKDELVAAEDRAASLAASRRREAEAYEAEARRTQAEHEAASHAAALKLEAAQARLRELEEQMLSSDVASVRKAAAERELAEAAAAMKAKHEAEAAERLKQLESARTELATCKEQLAHLQQALRAAEERALAESAKRAASEEEARGKLSVLRPERDGALADAAAAAKRADDLEQALAATKAELEALQVKFLSTPAPAPAASKWPSASEVALKAMRSELDGWKMVAEQAEMGKERAERELKAANRTITQMRKDADTNKENGKMVDAS